MSKDNPSAEIIAIGTEILLGEITDTNSVYLAQTLRDLGINVYFMTSVGDNVERIAKIIEIAMSRADIVVTCGGLGPTVDDMTRQGVSNATKRELVFNEGLYEQIKARFKSYGVAMPENNRRQAYIPEGAMIIENPVGTAPSFITPYGEKNIITLPGVPRELKYLMHEAVVPFLMAQYRVSLIKARILRVAGIGESALDEMLGNEILENANPTVGLAAHHGVIDVRITVKGQRTEDVEFMLDTIEKQVRDKIGRFVYGYGKEEIEHVALDLLASQGKTLAIVEAGLVNGVTKRLERVKSFEQVVKHATLFESPEGLMQVYGKISESVKDYASDLAKELAKENDYAVVVICDPDVDESPDNSESSVIVICDGEKTHVRAYGLGARNELTRSWLGRWGMSMVWRMAKEQ